MILTIYCVFATLMQWWRLNHIRNTLHALWSSKNAFLLSRCDAIHAETRRKCIERVMYFKSDRIVCTIKPIQTIHLTNWVKFPTDLEYFPFLIECKHVELNRSDIYFLVKCSLQYMRHEINVIQIEDYGELMAWRMTPHRFEAIVRSDIDNLAQLVLRYHHNILHMNSVMEIIEFETVNVRGQAAEIFYYKKYTESERLRITYSPGHWRRFTRELTELYEQIPHHSNPEIKIESGNSRHDEHKRAAGCEARPIENKKHEDRNTLEVSGTRPRRSKPIDIGERNNKHKPETSRKNTQSNTEVTRESLEYKVEPETSGASMVEKYKSISVNPSCSREIKSEVKVTNKETFKVADFDWELAAKNGNGFFRVDRRRNEPSISNVKNIPSKPQVAVKREDLEHEIKPEKSEASYVGKNKTTSPNQSSSKESKTKREAKNTELATVDFIDWQAEAKRTNGFFRVDHYRSPRAMAIRNARCNKNTSSKPEVAVTHEDSDHKVKPEKSEASIVEENKTSPNTSCSNAIKNEAEVENTQAVTCEDSEYKTEPEKSVDQDKTSSLNTSKELKDEGKDAELSGSGEVEKDKLNNVSELQICDEKTSISTLEDKKPEYCDKDGACALSILVPDKESVMQNKGVLDVPNCDLPKKSKTPSTPGKINTFANIDNRMISTQGVKPPNILVYGDTITAKENVKTVLNSVINGEKYIIYDLPTAVSTYPVWSDSTALVVICGATTPELKSTLLQYLISGGQLLCLCSDLLHSMLTVFSAAEVGEHELVGFSYGDWKRVRMMHHIFCYQASPAEEQFSQGSTESTNHSSGSSPIAPKTPAVAEINHNGKSYPLQVQVLGTEETWQSPSLLLASMKNSEGRAIFSQVHLEIDPLQYEGDEDKFIALKESNKDRLDILTHILTNQLGIDCSKTSNEVVYSIGYFLGRHESVNELLKKCPEMVDNKIDCGHVTMEFCEHGADPGIASSSRLPIMKYTNPPNFSTSHYFDTLSTEVIGRLVIYADILKSSQYLLSKPIQHGLVVIPRQQTAGVGRSNNTWLSPLGSACFSLQLHIPLSSPLGRMLTIVQHLIIVAVVEAIKKHPGYAGLDIGIKWPNDIYLNKKVKIGGLIANSTIGNKIAVLNIGCGLNLDNKQPTRSLNDYIMEYSDENNLKLERLSLEKYFALVFNELENLYDTIQNDNIDCFFDLYYKNWIHENSEVTIQTEDGETSNAKIEGIDDFGFLKVRRVTGEVCVVQPDGNTFDMIKGLIAPKPKFN